MNLDYFSRERKMPIYKSEKEALKQHINYDYDTDMEQKYDVGGHALFLYRAILEVVPKNSIVLDIGCNSGAVGRLLMQSKNIVCYGIDVSPVMVVRAIMKGIFAKPGQAEELPWQDNYFDVVLLMEILEHVYDPRVVFDEAARVTKEGGIVVGSVPHPRGQAGAKGFLRHKYHARVFNERSLRKLLKKYLKKVAIKNIYTDPDITGLPNWIFFYGIK